MQATFNKDGELKDTGKGAAPNVAEGLGGVNIKGVEDEKTQGREGKVANDAIQPISDRLHEGNAPGAVKHNTK